MFSKTVQTVEANHVDRMIKVGITPSPNFVKRNR